MTDNDGERVEETGPTAEIGGPGKAEEVPVSPDEEAQVSAEQGFGNAELPAEHADAVQAGRRRSRARRANGPRAPENPEAPGTGIRERVATPVPAYTTAEVTIRT